MKNKEVKMFNPLKFNAVDYALSFDFATDEENLKLASVMTDAWNKYKPTC